MKTLYTKLAESFSDEKFKVTKNKVSQHVDLHGLSHFVSMKGKLYDKQKCKLFIVGRAVNGWGSFAFDNSEEFGLKAEKEFAKEGFQWVVLDKNTLHNTLPMGSSDRVYYLSKSPFWRTSRQIFKCLSGKESPKWVDYIAWSNIYKISPPDTGNPSTKMCKKQIEICREILKKEIETYRPTHILLITGWNWWFEDKEFGVSQLFSSCKFIGENKRGNSVFVEGTAVYNERIPVVIACRPERRNENEYVREIISAF